MTLAMVDYLMGAVLINLGGVIFSIINTIMINSKIKKQQRLIDFIYTRAQKAKKLEEHREKLEDQRLSKLKKQRSGTKK